MALKKILENVDGLDEATRALYVKKDDGKYHLDLDVGDDTGGGNGGLSEAEVNKRVEAAVRAIREEAITERRKRQSWEKLGKTPEEIEAMIAADKDREATELEKKGDFEKVKAQMLERHQADISKVQKQLDEQKKETADARTALRDYMVTTEAVQAIAQAEGDTELLKPFVQRFIKAEEDEATKAITIKVIDDKGAPRVNAKGEPLSVPDLVAEMRASEKYGRVFKGSGQSGGGSRAANGAKVYEVARKAEFGEGNAGEIKRAAFIDKHGKDAYDGLPP